MDNIHNREAIQSLQKRKHAEHWWKSNAYYKEWIRTRFINRSRWRPLWPFHSNANITPLNTIFQPTYAICNQLKPTTIQINHKLVEHTCLSLKDENVKSLPLESSKKKSRSLWKGPSNFFESEWMHFVPTLHALGRNL